MARHLSCQLHSQLLEDVTLVMDCLGGQIDARTWSEPFDDFFDHRVILHDMSLPHDLQKVKNVDLAT